MFGSVANAMQWDAPTADSSIPPTQQGIPCFWHRSWISTGLGQTTHSPGLRLIHRQERSSMAFRAFAKQ